MRVELRGIENLTFTRETGLEQALLQSQHVPPPTRFLPKRPGVFRDGTEEERASSIAAVDASEEHGELDIWGLEPHRKGPETMRDQAIQESGDAGQGGSRPAAEREDVDQVHASEELMMRLLDAGLTGADLHLIVATLDDQRTERSRRQADWQKYADELGAEPSRQQFYQTLADEDAGQVKRLTALLAKLI